MYGSGDCDGDKGADGAEGGVLCGDSKKEGEAEVGDIKEKAGATALEESLPLL